MIQPRHRRTGQIQRGRFRSDRFEPGHPLGVSRTARGFRFAVFSSRDEPLTLSLYEPDHRHPFSEHVLEPEAAGDDEVRALELHGLPAVFEHTWRIGKGPPVVDPYARLLAGGQRWGRSDDALGTGLGRRYRGLVIPDVDFEWQGVPSPRVPAGRRIVYELHVRGFTRHASSGVAHPGTYLGVIEKIPHLVELGVTTVELMPLFEFDETENPRRDPFTGQRLLNFWGYSPVSFFAPKAAYAADPAPGAAATELKTLVRELHRAGLEVVLDVVYNHTAEGGGGRTDPLHSWRAFDDLYYLTDPATGEALDVTGCGNTVNVNHPVVRRMILDSLRHWAEEYRVDGFRFDLAGVFYRGEHGEVLDRSPIVEEIAGDPALAGRLLVAEPWDARGLTPRAGFPAPWLEWDGEFRDGIRRFVGGREPEPRPLARRLGAFGPKEGAVPPERAVRFVSCHDGRPLADVVAWAQKHNDSNGEGNRDGWDGEVAWNGGVEGPTEEAAIQERRAREVRLLLALLAMAPGTIQLTAGDELGRTQRGNTNAWCQDNEIGWTVWPVAKPDLTVYTQQLLLLRERLSAHLAAPAALVEAFEGPSFFPSMEASGLGLGSFLLLKTDEPCCWLIAANASESEKVFPLPMAPAGKRWRLRLDSASAAAAAVLLDDVAPFLSEETSQVRVAPRSARVLVAER